MEFSAAVFFGGISGLPGLGWAASDALCGGAGCYGAAGVGKFGSISLTNITTTLEIKDVF